MYLDFALFQDVHGSCIKARILMNDLWEAKKVQVCCGK